MINDDLAKSLEEEMAKDLGPTKVPLRVATMPKANQLEQREVTLTEQWAMHENIERELRERIRKEGLRIIAEHDRRWSEIKHDYANRISEAVARLEQERDEELNKLVESYRIKNRELHLLTQRIDD